MQFQTPQFIDVESKIVGPLTLKQFLYLAAAGGVSFLLFFTLQTWIWFIITAVLAVIAISLAFVKYNGQPLPKIAIRALFFFWRPRLYLWQRQMEEKIINIPRIQSAESQRRNLKDFFSEMPSVKKLYTDLMTSRNPIPKREKSGQPAHWGRKQKEGFAALRKLTGEKEIARRIDYR